MRPLIDQEACIGCGNCFNVCPTQPNVFETDDHESKVVHPEACIGCMECEVNCPVSAIRMLDE
jgi:2-oxoglutarate ferredoxin oxidoreductase subunit delta